MDAIILAGGQGKRLRPLTDGIPKCMAPLNGKPMIQYHIDWLKKHNIEKIIVACGFKWEKIKHHYGNSLVYSVEGVPLGTGGAIRKALEHVGGKEFIVANCDDINNVDIKKLQKLGSNAICLSKLPSPFGVVEVKNGYVTRFRQKPLLPHWVNMGVYILNRDIKLPKIGAIEDETFTKIRLKAYEHDGFWFTINTMKDLEDAEKYARKYGL